MRSYELNLWKILSGNYGYDTIQEESEADENG